MEKLPNWARYILAIPYGLLLAIIFGLITQISIYFFTDPNSLYAKIITFIYTNGINIILMFYGINLMLPNNKFKITLIISIILGIAYSILQGISIIFNTISIEYLIAYIEVIICLVISCYYSYNKKFD